MAKRFFGKILSLRLPMIFVLTGICIVLSGCGDQFSSSSKTESVYLFSYFKDNGADGLHLAFSPDGFKWMFLNNDKSFLTPAVSERDDKEKLMRDPCICKGPDGVFHMVWTVGWGQKGIGYAFTKDLVNWSEQKYIPVMEYEPKARNCWAPEVFYDSIEKQFVIFWATTIEDKFLETKAAGDDGWNHRMYYTTTKDFKHFASTGLFYEPGFNVIDSTIIKAGRKYVMFLKNETRHPPQKNIRMAVSDSSTGSFGPASEPITGDYWAEGPTAIKIKNKWYVYFDKYTENRYGMIASADLKNWQDVSEQLEFPAGVRHGTIFEVSKSFFDNLVETLERH